MHNRELLADEARGYFFALAEVLRELEESDLLGRLAELYKDFRLSEFYGHARG
jgi:hypothetical protein